MDVQVQIPDDVARVLQSEQPDLSRAALEALALEGYRSERISEAQVRRMLGFRTRMQVHAFLKAHNVYLNYSTEELERDLDSLKGFEENAEHRNPGLAG
jgi:predicted HTH domain antitoxin